MPLIDPVNAAGHGLREKIVLIGAGGSGKSTAWLSIAWWAHQSGDVRNFWVMDTDDEAVLQVMDEDRYQGMLLEDGGHVSVSSVRTWADYQEFSDKALANAKPGDWIVLDFVSHAWAAAQDGYLQDAVNKTRDKALYEAGVEGLSGWDMFKTDFNWNAINGAYFGFIKPILLRSRAHLFMTSEEEEIQDSRNMTPDAKEHVAQFGKWKAAGVQKKIPYQCRTYLRVQRLARGRVLYTLKDRARQELNGDDMKPDFYQAYLRNVAGWGISE